MRRANERDGVRGKVRPSVVQDKPQFGDQVPVRFPERETPDLQRQAQWLGMAAVLLGAVDLLGWIFGVDVLTSGFPGYATMKPNTAIGLGLLGIACLWRRRAEDGVARLAVIADLASGLAFAMGAATLGEILLRQNFGLDSLFLRVQVDSYGDPAGRMAPGTAVCVLLAGAGLLLLDRRPRLSMALVIAVLTVGMSALVGFAFDAGPLFGVPALRSLSVLTAIGILLVALATLALRTEREPVVSLLQQRLYGGRTGWLLPGVTIVPLLVALPLLAGLRLVGTTRRSRWRCW